MADERAGLTKNDMTARTIHATMIAKEATMILTAEQRTELDGNEPARAIDPTTNVTYVLVRADVYDQMRRVVDGFARRAGWDDPELDVYEQYRKPA